MLTLGLSSYLISFLELQRINLTPPSINNTNLLNKKLLGSANKLLPVVPIIFSADSMKLAKIC